LCTEALPLLPIRAVVNGDDMAVILQDPVLAGSAGGTAELSAKTIFLCELDEL
jgi:hypothetical protein